MKPADAIRIAASLLIAASVATAGEQYPAWMKEVGYDRLVEAFPNLSTGANVPVTIVESGGYPDAADPRFAGKTLTRKSGDAEPTKHATIVAGLYFGAPPAFAQRSVVGGVRDVEMFLAGANGWAGEAFLSPPGEGVPRKSANLSRVASHAYHDTTVFGFLIPRQDWIVEKDDYVQVVYSVSHAPSAIDGQGQGFNSIAVGRSDGKNGTGGTIASESDPVYAAGRYKPDLCGSHGTASDSIGMVSGVATLLISLSRDKPELSHHSYESRRNPDAPDAPTYTVRSADTSEVIKAALMAGAMRETSGHTWSGNINDYRVDEKNRTDNGLDKRWGAGIVNVLSSYQIVAAGEQGSREDAPEKQGVIKQHGFDYDPTFGGSASSNDTATYTFKASAAGKFAATLAWNVRIAGGEGAKFDPKATLYDLDLELFDVTTRASVQKSASKIDNTETVWSDLVAGNVYELRVTRKGPAFLWDYGLAWCASVPLEAP